ncbi:MAG: Grx4 family monothiol glutaredoxin [Micavibrio sp.]|nr:Grx4 family monothiol glutaredoxin [Micavibrio sp.]
MEREKPAHQRLIARIRSEVTGHDVVLYMKGTPAEPQCGYSAAVVHVLDNLAISFTAVDVLTDPALRQAIKDYSSWPTLPQLYIKGKFIGGCDITRELYANGELQNILRAAGLLPD